ncbi:COX15/CtaA family protein [Lampropedia cohaerens]|uniref:COX15/CtaA family protein n=1 Tax=Lampropedia cohaerens TaxID=1610491 RepID=UPI000A07D465|nr:COX15/CtaA family protein [Lampropedia cohaerens]
MNAQVALYDWAPLVELLLVGVLVALVPLVWVWRRNRHRGMRGFLHALVVATLVLTFDLVLFGAFTRLTDSGLGCPDWPGCYGNASPVGAHAEIAAAQQAMPDGPVTHGKAWIEMIHRYLATGVGALTTVLTVLGWHQWLRWRRSQRQQAAQAPPLHPVWPTVTLLWVLLQGAFGAWTVTMKLFPAIVTLHLLGGVVLLALLCAQAVRWRQITAAAAPHAIGRGLRMLAWAVFAVVLVQIALGGWVSTNYAVLACATFPDCNGAWWPEMDVRQGFTLWRELGHQADGNLIEFPALVAIHYVHRLFALVVVASAAWLAVALWRRGGALRRAGQRLAILVAAQLLTGLSNVVLGWPLLAAILHTGGAAALVVVLTQLLADTRVRMSGRSTELITESNLSRYVDTHSRWSAGPGRRVSS